MPPPCAHWPDVKATAIATGNLREAAEAHQVSYDAVRQRASREQWPVGQRVHRMAEEAREMANQAIIQCSKGTVTSVTSAADALANEIASEGKLTKLHGMRYARRTVQAAADEALTAPLLALERAALVKASLQSAAISGDWQQAQAGPTQVINIALLGTDLPEMPRTEPQMAFPVIDMTE